MSVETQGRTDLDDLFRLSGLLEFKRLEHTPFLAFIERDGDVYVEIVDSARKAALLPADTKLMVQWQGRWRSDYFQMTAGDVARALAALS